MYIENAPAVHIKSIVGISLLTTFTSSSQEYSGGGTLVNTGLRFNSEGGSGPE